MRSIKHCIAITNHQKLFEKIVESRCHYRHYICAKIFELILKFLAKIIKRQNVCQNSNPHRSFNYYSIVFTKELSNPIIDTYALCKLYVYRINSLEVTDILVLLIKCNQLNKTLKTDILILQQEAYQHSFVSSPACVNKCCITALIRLSLHSSLVVNSGLSLFT